MSTQTKKLVRRKPGEKPKRKTGVKGYDRPPYRLSLELDGDIGEFLEEELARRNDALPENYLEKGKRLWTKRAIIEELLGRAKKSHERRQEKLAA